ncbi:MAG: hypothetical protein Q8P97_02580 [bacterium]|nr:hypothetical protein [bacterium]
MIIAKNINWETDGEKVSLPKQVKLPNYVANCRCADLSCESNTESVNSYLSDTYGWLIKDYNLVEE